MEIIQIVFLGVFILTAIIGYKLINNVPSLLHTPLMSGMNALSGITVLGALTAMASAFGTAGKSITAGILGGIAIVLAMINVVGGFVVTDKMLRMFKKGE
ncbi:MAG: NAD(P) transhydrogenase subunit alpha [Clostridia bacterium]